MPLHWPIRPPSPFLTLDNVLPALPTATAASAKSTYKQGECRRRMGNTGKEFSPFSYSGRHTIPLPPFLCLFAPFCGTTIPLSQFLVPVFDDGAKMSVVFSGWDQPPALVVVQRGSLDGGHRLRERARRRLAELMLHDSDGVGLLPQAASTSPPRQQQSPSTWPHFGASVLQQQQQTSSLVAVPSLPRFHFALVLLSLSIISLTVLCAIACYLRILNEQRRTRRQRRVEHAREGDLATNAAEKERLARVNKFIARNGSQVAIAIDTAAVAKSELPPTQNKQRVPRIMITESCSGEVETTEQRPPAVEEWEGSAPRAEDRGMGEMGAEEFIRAVLSRVERDQGQMGA